MEVKGTILDNADLVRRLCHALDVAGQAVEQLAASGYVDPDGSLTVQAEKVISETGLLLLAAATAEIFPSVRERIDAVAQKLIPHARSQRMRLGMCLEPTLALDYAQAHICLSRIGYADAEFDELLEQCLASQAQQGRERKPHRVLEQEWIRGLWLTRDGQHVTAAEMRRVLAMARQSILGTPMDVLGGSREDIYGFTHAVMFITDSHLPRRRLPRSRTALLGEAEALLARCLDTQDYDLAGEVLLTWPLIGKQWTPVGLFGLRVIAGVEDQAGFLPSPATRVARLDGLQGVARTKYLLASSYHTIYVMGLVCAASLRLGYQSASKAVKPHQAGSAKQILSLLDVSDDAHWMAILSQLPEREQDAVAELLLAIVIQRNVRGRNYRAVSEALALADKLGLANSSIAAQAAELLERLTKMASTVR